MNKKKTKQMLINILKYLRSIIALCLVCYCISIPKFTYNQTLHAIIVAATNEDNHVIRKGIQLTVDAMEDEIDLIHKNTKLTTKYYKVTGQDFESAKLRHTIDNIYCNNDDVIFFYFDGHGFRYRDQIDKWPILAVGYDIHSIQEAFKYGVPFSEIIESLKNKGARLTFMIADCCNSATSYSTPVDKEIIGQASLSFSIRLPERFRELYENSSGTIIASSSIPGQESRVSNVYGSYFTSSLIEVHKELTSISNNANWEDILEKSKNRTIRITELNNKKEQIPQFEVNVNTIFANPGFNWNGVINSNRNVFRETPSNFQYNNQYNYYQYPVARIVMFNNNKVFFLMSDNYIVEYAPYRGGLILTGYRAFSSQPQRFQWDIVNPISPYQSIIYGVDYNGMMWSWNNYSMRWENVGVVYY
ncbi:caspase family protein [Candidatus Babeliales bacterium]|nr:caspase family protein [Candidatus Babeliales bacterium]